MIQKVLRGVDWILRKISEWYLAHVVQHTEKRTAIEICWFAEAYWRVLGFLTYILFVRNSNSKLEPFCIQNIPIQNFLRKNLHPRKLTWIPKTMGWKMYVPSNMFFFWYPCWISGVYPTQTSKIHVTQPKAGSRLDGGSEASPFPKLPSFQARSRVTTRNDGLRFLGSGISINLLLIC